MHAGLIMGCFGTFAFSSLDKLISKLFIRFVCLFRFICIIYHKAMDYFSIFFNRLPCPTLMYICTLICK